MQSKLGHANTMFTVLLLVISFAYLLHRLITWNYDFWKIRGVPSPPVSYFFGNLRDSITLKKSLGQIYTDIYNAYNSFPYVGFYKIRIPSLIVRDPAIIRDILVKDFNNFHDNDIDIEPTDDPLIGKNLFVLRGRKWKVLRALLSTCFTSGKLKTMFPPLSDVSTNLVKYLEQKCNCDENTQETKEVAAKFTTDSVAKCAFGMEGRSFLDSKPEFREVARKILEPSFWMGIKHLCIFVFPALSKLINLKFVPDDAAAYLRKIVKTTLKFRTENNIVKNDFLDSISQLKQKTCEYGFTDEDVTAHAMSFFIDGFETSSIAMSFALYELAANPSTQEKLRAEISDVLNKHAGNFTYDALQDMTYLDCVLSETLRKYPPGLFFMKRCTIEYSFPAINAGAAPLTVEAGTPIIIPLYALQHDAKYFPEPEKFNPERFLEENKQNIVKGTYLPFGEGPRVCVAQRFALLQIKVGIVAVITNFEVRVNKKTIEPIQIDPRYFMICARGGLWLDYRKLNK